MMSIKRLYIFLISIVVCCQLAFTQESGEMIRGKLISDSGEELISANVLEVDATGRVVTNTITDMNGGFSMKIKNQNNKLRFSYLGFRMQEVPIGARRDFQIIMKEDNILEEVIIAAKKTVSKGGLDIPANEVSYAAQKISSSVFSGLQVASIDDALQGHIAGLDIIGSGNIGVSTQMRLRGISSLSASATPLIVIDGIQRPEISTADFDFSGATEQQFSDLLMINPEDIEDITVLKDAGATAIYGSRGASGVLEIRTKRGSRGPTRLTYTYKFTGAQQPEGMKMLNGDKYTMLMKQAYFNPSQNPAASDIREFAYDPTWSEYRHYNNNTDWRKEVIQYGLTHNHNITVTGGGERAQFRITGGYMTEGGTIIGQNWNRYTSRMNLDYYISSRIKVTTEVAFTYSDNDYNWTDGRGVNNGKSILYLAYKKMPNMSVYRKDENGQNLPSYYTMLESSRLYSGDQGSLRNPVALARLATNNTKTYDMLPVMRLSYDLIEPGDRMLKYEGYISFDMNNSKSHKFLPREVSPLTWDSEDINRVENNDSEKFGIQTENKLIFKPSLGQDHSLSGYISLQTSSGTTNRQNLLAYGLPNEQISAPYAPAVVREVGSSLEQYRTLAMKMYVHYAFRSKYILDLQINREGSTRFGKANKFGNFPGVSLRWNISDEPFMNASKSWLSLWSLRPSWGITGDRPPREYMHFSTYIPWSSYMETSTIRPDNIRLSNLKWARKNEYNLGMDLELWNGKYTMDANFYYSLTDDLLWPDAPIPGSSGFNNLSYRNVGSMRNIGWELNAQGNRFLQVGNVFFDAYLNVSNSVNSLIYLDQDILDSQNKEYEYMKRDASYLQHLEPKHAYGSIYGFRYKGVYQYSIDHPVVVNSNYEAGT